MIFALSASHDDIGRIAGLNIFPPFEFIVKNHSYMTNLAAAALISRKAQRIRTEDCLADYVILDIPDENHEFQQIMDLISGKSIRIDGSNADYFQLIGERLESRQIISAVLEFRGDKDELNTTNVIERFMLKSRYGIGLQREAEFIAEHFPEFSIGSLKKLSISQLQTIISSPAFIPNMQILFLTIMKLGREYFGLLKNVRIDTLDRDDILLLLQNAKLEDFYDEIWAALTKSIQGFLAYAASKSDSTEMNIPGQKIEMTGTEDAWTGIFAHFNRLCKGNSHIKGILAVTASSNGDSVIPVHKLIEYSRDRQDTWFSCNLKNSWIKFDFKSRCVSLTSYVLRGARAQGTNMRYWVVSGSNDDVHWDQIDEQRQNNQLTGNFKSARFICSTSNPYRYIRIMQTDVNDKYNYTLALSGAELLGYIYE